MTDGRDGVYADAIILPFSITIPDPRPVVNDGMSRLDPIVNHPARGWPGDRPSTYWPLDDLLGFAAQVFGVPSARAQAIPPEEEVGHHGADAHDLQSAEKPHPLPGLRVEEPGGPAVPILPPRSTPAPAATGFGEAQKESTATVGGTQRAGEPRPGETLPAFESIVQPNGTPRGIRYRSGRSYSDPQVRTVTPEEFEGVRAQLLRLPFRIISRPDYKGTWHDLGGGRGFGFRNNRQGIRTIDIQSSQFEKGYRFHEQ